MLGWFFSRSAVVVAGHILNFFALTSWEKCFNFMLNNQSIIFQKVFCIYKCGLPWFISKIWQTNESKTQKRRKLVLILPISIFRPPLSGVVKWRSWKQSADQSVIRFRIIRISGLKLLQHYKSMLWILNYGHHFDVLTDQRIIFSFVVLWHLTIVSRDLNHYVYFNLHAFNFHTYTKWTKKIFFVGFNKKGGKLTFFWLNSDGFCRVIAKYKSGFLKRVWSIYVFFHAFTV